MTIVYIIIAFVFGFGMGYSIELTINYIRKRFTLDENKMLREQVGILQEEAATALQEHQQAIDSLKQEHQQALAAVKKESQQAMESERQRFEMLFKSNIETLKVQVAAATEEMLRRRGDELQQSNKQQMDAILKPLTDNIGKMEQSIRENRDTHITTTTALKTAMEHMMQTTQNLGNQADRLSNALCYENKVAGNFGELVLKTLLDTQGLKEGENYEVQHTLRDASGQALRNEDTGKRMVPDVVLHLSDNHDLIVDSKVSLTAFVDYCNATDEAARDEAAKRHLASVESHIKELKAKNYQDYIQKPRESADFVIMFVPNEGALQLALERDKSLWNRAFENKVFIAGRQTLTAALHIIDLTWKVVKQERNTELIIDEARKIVDRIGGFYTAFQEVGERLNDVQKAYATVKSKAVEGKQSILGAGNRLEELGVKGKKALPSATD